MEPDEDEERFVQEEISVTEIAPELELAARNKQLQAKVEMLESQLRNASSIAEEPTETAPDAMDVVISEDNNVEEEDTGDESGDRSLSVQEKRHVKRQRQKERKSQSLVKELPKLHQKIVFKETNTSPWIPSKVVKVYKKTSIHQNWRHLQLESGIVIERDFAKKIVDWKIAPEELEEESLSKKWMEKTSRIKHVCAYGETKKLAKKIFDQILLLQQRILLKWQ